MPSHLTCWLVAAALASLPRAQDPAQWLRDLGDPARSEAAEIGLVQLGVAAQQPLASLLQDFDPAGPDAEARLRAALRVIDLLGADVAELQSDLDALAVTAGVPALVDLIWTRGSLAPFSGSSEWSTAFHKTVGRHPERGRLIEAFQRHAIRLQVRASESVDKLLQRLADNKLFEREVAAELLGRSGAVEAVAALQQSLLDRATRPAGWDGLKHNGFVVPMHDGFRLRAAEALLRLAAEDPPAVALGCRALLHPHRRVRLQALQSLGSLGPRAQAAVPELLQLADADDPELASEALKVLGMSGTTAPGCLAVAERLLQSQNPEVQKRARSLAVRLRAMKVELPAAGPADPDAPALAAAVAALGSVDKGAVAETEVLQAGAAAVPRLLRRMTADGESTPDAVLRMLAVVGRGLDAEARTDVRHQLMQRHGENWSAPSMSSGSGGGSITDLDREVYADLYIGNPEKPGDLAAFLQDDNAFVRLQAARRMVEAGGAGEQDVLRQALLAAARSEHPRQSSFESRPRATRKDACDLDRQIQAAAAAALVSCELPPEVQRQLLPKVVAFEDGAVVATALRRWGGLEGLDALRRGLGDPRPVVAVAAAETIGQLAEAAAAAMPELRRAAASGVGEVAAAAKAALLRVQGDG